MNRMLKAVFKVEVSPTLIRLWDEHNRKPGSNNIWDWVMVRHIAWIGAFAFPILVSAIVIFHKFLLGLASDIKGIFFPGVGFLLLTGLFLFALLVALPIIKHIWKRWKAGESLCLPDWEFLDDCKKLYISSTSATGMMNETELREFSRGDLIGLAVNVLRAESQSLSATLSTNADGWRQKFKDTHERLRRFGLVSAEWDEYFREAKQHTSS